MSDREDLYGLLFEPGDVIFRQGDPGDVMYLIQSGAVEYTYKRGGEDVLLDVLEQGDFFGEKVLLGAEARPATAVAARRTRLLPLARAGLLDRVRDDPGVALHLLQGLIARAQLASRQVQRALEEDEDLRSALAARGTSGGAFPAAPAEADPRVAPEPDLRAPLDVTPIDLAEIWGIEHAPTWFEPGQHIFREGDRGDALYVILGGAVEMTTGGERSVFAPFRLSAGDFFGESEMVTGEPRASSAKAVVRTLVMAIERDAFLARIHERPELALFVLQALTSRIQQLGTLLARPEAHIGDVRRSWQPLLAREERIRLSIVALSTCAGCSAAFLDQESLDRVLGMADLVYCPMLIDETHIGEADVALVEGVVRLEEDADKLREARAKSRMVIAWGTCACFGGIPAHANRYELEDLVQETYGQTTDAWAYYLSGERGVEQAAYQEEGIPLLRRAYRLDDFARVDYYVPGCPPDPALLFQLHAELTGEDYVGARPLVCSECGRKLGKNAVTTLDAYPREDVVGTCFHSQGVLCAGFLTKGGCGAICTQSGLPCWGCRGPAKTALRPMAEGDSYEEVLIGRLARRCRIEKDELRPLVRRLRSQGHALYGFDQGPLSGLSRIR